MTQEEYMEYSDTYEGFCINCGETQGGVDPDGRAYTCEYCEENKVYGFEELMIMGYIIFEGGEA